MGANDDHVEPTFFGHSAEHGTGITGDDPRRDRDAECPLGIGQVTLGLPLEFVSGLLGQCRIEGNPCPGRTSDQAGGSCHDPDKGRLERGTVEQIERTPCCVERQLGPVKTDQCPQRPTARSSCALVILERPLMFLARASL